MSYIRIPRPDGVSVLRPETFSSRPAIIVAGLGMAVGTGNLWRFPRIAAQNGGAAFLIPWMLFLVAWSLPLLIAEFGWGRGARRGPLGAFVSLVGEEYAWVGDPETDDNPEADELHRETTSYV